jgi:hypothetical protein
MNGLMKGGVLLGLGTVSMNAVLAALGVVCPPIVVGCMVFSSVAIGAMGILENSIDDVDMALRKAADTNDIVQLRQEEFSWGISYYYAIPSTVGLSMCEQLLSQRLSQSVNIKLQRGRNQFYKG